jgi:MFS family permease
VAKPDETLDPAPRLELSRAQMNVVFVTILLGLLLSALDQTIVSTALPTIVGDLGGAGHVSWVVTAYMLAETVSTVLAGKFGDLFGRKRVFQLGVAMFIVGSFFCGLANSMMLLITFRAVQGLGGGAITVTATALIADVIPLRLRGQYQGALGAVFGVTTVIGPLLGGGVHRQPVLALGVLHQRADRGDRDRAGRPDHPAAAQQGVSGAIGGDA